MGQMDDVVLLSKTPYVLVQLMVIAAVRKPIAAAQRHIVKKDVSLDLVHARRRMRDSQQVQVGIVDFLGDLN